MSINPLLKPISVELLAIDLDSCGRCTGTAENLTQALALAAPTLDAVGIQVELTETTCRTADEARLARLESSPTVRIDGIDIDPAKAETACEASACCDPQGDPIDCRVWSHRGETYHAAPVGLLVEHLLRSAVARIATDNDGENASDQVPHELSANLERFYGQPTNGGGCCSSQEAATCCDAADKAECCSTQATAEGGCGCR